MDKAIKKSVNKQLKLQVLVVVIAALLMALTVFLPYATAIGDRAESIKESPSAMVYRDLNMTAGDMRHISIFEYTRIYCALCEEIWGEAVFGIFYAVIFWLIVGISLLIVLLALGRKPIGIMLFDIAVIAVFHIQNTDYSMRGVIPSSSYAWGIAHYLFPIAAIVVFGAAVWMLVQKIKLKSAAKREVAAMPKEV